MARPPSVSIHVRVPPSRRRATADDIVNTVVEDIAKHRLAPGLRLPAVRELEHQLGISKNTAQAAYDELVARGLAESRPREGVYITAPEGLTALPTKRLGAPQLVAPRVLPSPLSSSHIHLSTVFIDPELLPVEQLTSCFRSVLASPGLTPFYDAQGYPPLRAALAERLRARGMEVEADDIVLTTGSQQVIDIVARSLEGRRVALEDPVYAHARHLFEGVGKEIVPLPPDPFEGMPLDAWAAAIDRARPAMLYAITGFQNPTGYSYSTYELVQLLELG